MRSTKESEAAEIEDVIKELKKLDQEKARLLASLSKIEALIKEKTDDLIFKEWGIKLGTPVRDNKGREGIVSRIEVLNKNKPWVSFKYKRASGELTKREYFISDQWHLI